MSNSRLGLRGSSQNEHRPLIAARGIRKSFGGTQVFHDVCVDLRPGQVVVLRGENGSGKTTLLNILTGNLSPDAGELEVSVNAARDQFRWPLSWWRRLNPFSHFTPERVACAGVGRVWQDIRLFGTFSVLDNVTVASRNRAGEHPQTVLLQMGKATMQEAANQALARERLERLGLGAKLASSCDKLSLGQMKRAAIARAVQTGARVIMLDEPLAGLDGNGRKDVLDTIRELGESGHHTVVIIEHVFNLPRVLTLATHVWTLKDGVVQIESPSAVADEIRAGNGRLLSPFEQAGDIPSGTDHGHAALEALDLGVRRGYRRVFERFSLRTRGGGHLESLAYPNGWGKTTLFDAIAGMIPMEKGRILLGGRDVTQARSWERARLGLSYLRSVNNVVPNLTVREHFSLVRGRETLASRFGEWQELIPPKDKRAELLSGGEKQRLALGCLPLGSVMLLDEPFLNLDQAAIEALISILRRVDRATLIAVPSAGID